MPTTKVELAWAVEVKIHKFGAYVQAYCNLQPTLLTLRLCNRFGNGDKATINKLPVEMIQLIETHLMQDEKARTLPDWTRDMGCWEGKCKRIDHLTDETILSWYNDMHEDIWYNESDCGCGTRHGASYRRRTKVTRSIREWMIEDLRTASEGGEDGMWRDVHNQRVRSWWGRVGKPTEASRGKFDIFAAMIRENFGLEVWIAHDQDPEPNDLVGDSVTQSTKAYLRLPQSSLLQQEWEPVIADYDYSPRRQPTESGSASAIIVPPTPSEASLARFDRALKILGLRTVCEMQTSFPDPKASAEDAQAIVAASKTRSKPKLTMFIRNCDESEY